MSKYDDETPAAPATATVVVAMNCLECGSTVKIAWPVSSEPGHLYSCGQCAFEGNVTSAVDHDSAAEKAGRDKLKEDNLAEFNASKVHYWAWLHVKAEAFGLQI